MRRYRAYVQPLMALLAVCILLITGGLYMLSNRLVSNSYAGLSRQEISQCVSIGQRLLADYRSGEITLDELREAVNPTLNPAEAFLLLTDPEGNVLCATEAAADLLSALPVRRLIQGLTQSEEPQPVVNHATEHTLLLMGQRTPEGAVLAGKSLSAYTSALAVFRGLLLRIVLPLAVLLLAVSMYLSHVMSKPADILVEAAQKLSEGELVQIEQPLPPDLKPIGQAFNRMSHRLGAVLGEVGYERDMLALVLESLHEGVMAMDEAGDMLHENRAARRLLGGERSSAYREVTERLQRAITETLEPEKMQLGEKTLLIRFSPLPVRQEQRRGAIAMILDITEAERRIPVQYAKRVVGRKQYGGQSTHLPMKVNMSGVMPIIFAQSIASVPATIAAFTGKTDGWVATWFGNNSIPYAIIYFLLIIFFAYFYSTIQFNPIEVANNLKKNGGYIPGFRPGKPTSEFIQKVLNKITLFGAIYLGIIAVVPILVAHFSQSAALTGISLGGTSIIIVVGVALETVRALEAQMLMRNYKGFLD